MRDLNIYANIQGVYASDLSINNKPYEGLKPLVCATREEVMNFQLTINPMRD